LPAVSLYGEIFYNSSLFLSSMSRQMAVTKSVLPPVGVAASRFFHNKMVLQAGGGEGDFLPGKKNFLCFDTQIRLYP